MRQAIGRGILGAILLVGTAAFAAGDGDVVVRMNGGDDVAYIGETNTVEIWIRNDELLTAMKLGFRCDIGRDFDYNFAGTHHNGWWVIPEEVVTAFDDVIWQMHTFSYYGPDVEEFGVNAFALENGLAPRTSHTLALTLQIDISPDQEPLANGLVVDNTNMWIGASNQDFLEWQFNDLEGPYAPDYQGRDNSSVYSADASPIPFHIVHRDRSACCDGAVGDINGSGGDDPTIGDLSALIDHLFVGCRPLFCDGEADINGSGGEITVGDVSALIDHLFIHGNPLPSCQ